MAERAFGVPADTTTRYRVASITKLFTAVLVMQLHQEGRLHVDSALARYLPGYPGEGADRVTLHQLLNHTSGIQQFDRETSFQQAVENGIERYQKPHTTDALLARCCSGPLEGEPGAEFTYNNADYIVLGKVIEAVAGRPYDEVLRERILRPLGMCDTDMLLQSAVLPRLAPTYFHRDDTGTLINDLPVYMENWYAAGGMYSTASRPARVRGCAVRRRAAAAGRDRWSACWRPAWTSMGTACGPTRSSGADAGTAWPSGRGASWARTLSCTGCRTRTRPSSCSPTPT